MTTTFKYGRERLLLEIPQESIIYSSNYPTKENPGSELLANSIANPISCNPLKELIQQRRNEHVTIVVSDITRPIPYQTFLPELIQHLLNYGIKKENITLLVATGMHRASTAKEKIEMFGESITNSFPIIDHNAEDEDNLLTLPGHSWSGAKIRLNRYYVEAGFRIVTGLVEPHFMAGFSGGRKSICPGLAALETIQKFHGYQFLSNSQASNAILENNPCHLECTSIARMCPPDFCINIILNQDKQLHDIISGEPFSSHIFAINYLKDKCCKKVIHPADLVITSCGGYPLDTTFYQCIKGLVNCLPAVKKFGSIIAFGSCTEGIGSPEYQALMKTYAYHTEIFLEEIRKQHFFIKDQWQFQMHIRVLQKIGLQNLHFYTSGLSPKQLKFLAVNPHSTSPEMLKESIQQHINHAIRTGKKIAVLPEGPYCSPIY